MLEALSYLSLLGDNPFEIALTFLRNGGVFLFLFLLCFFAWKGWVSYVGGLYASKKKFVLLAIDIPRVNEQSMKAVEQIISTLHGVHKAPGKKDIYWGGVSEDVFSLEIVSIDGYIQYFVRCDDYSADLVKSAFFAQYPDAEIIEVEDYAQNIPKKYPDEKMDLWGTEFVLTNSGAYPIKTYDHFEHSLTGVFADPMAAILESLSRLRPGEQVWLQILITPMGSELRDEGLDEVNSLIGKSVAKKNRFGIIGQLPGEFLDEARRQMFATDDSWLSSSGGGSESNFSSLTTGEQIVVEEVQKKISRLAFSTKFRMVYVSPKEVMHVDRVIGSVFGSLKQFNTLDLNGFTMGKATTSSGGYFFTQRKQNQKKMTLLQAYENRDTGTGDNPYPLSTTELATIFHFPVDTVRAPLVSRTTSKKSEPPSGLPLERESPFDALRTQDSSVSAPSTAVEQEVPAQNSSLPQKLVIPQAIEPSLHSMPGLPPGVKPVASASVQSAPIKQEAPKIPPTTFVEQGMLHSMPGLPPGVIPKQQVQSAQQSQSVKNHTPQKIVVPIQSEMPQTQFVEQRPVMKQSHLIPPPEYVAQQQQPPVTAQKEENQNTDASAGQGSPPPPPNLPIG